MLLCNRSLKSILFKFADISQKSLLFKFADIVFNYLYTIYYIPSHPYTYTYTTTIPTYYILSTSTSFLPSQLLYHLTLIIIIYYFIIYLLFYLLFILGLLNFFSQRILRVRINILIISYIISYIIYNQKNLIAYISTRIIQYSG